MMKQYPVKVSIYPYGAIRVVPGWRVFSYKGDVFYDGEHTALIDGQEVRGSVYELNFDQFVFVPQGFGC